MKILRKITAVFVSSIIAFTCFGFLNAKDHVDASSGVGVAYRTQDEIKAYIASHTYSDSGVTYAESPSTSSPLSLGQISYTTEESALNKLNIYRYIAGLDEVTINTEYSKYAQGAALISAVNKTMSHTPSRPSEMDDSMYNTCYTGARSSNLYMGLSSLTRSVDGWMSDSDSHNIQMVGHRRWILNPAMGSTGFGCVGSYTAMYDFDRSNNSASSVTGVCWPAQNTPVEYFNSNTPWSVTVGSSLNASSVNVKVTSKSSGRVWNFSASVSDGEFYVNNGNYGQTGCIIFRPTDITVADGLSYDIYITGAGSTISYTVNFFSVSSNSGNVQSFVSRLYTTCLNRSADSTGLTYWTNKLSNHEISGTQAARGFFWSNEYLSANHSNEEYVKNLYKTFLGREPDATGKSYWLNKLANGVSREEVFYGFANSIEFENICASYGITR